MENVTVEKTLDNIRLGSYVYLIKNPKIRNPKKNFMNYRPTDKEKELYHQNDDDPFVTQFIDLLFKELLYFPWGPQACGKDTGGTSRSLSSSAGHLIYLYNILVGTGTNAVTLTDYALQTPVVNGTGAGQLLYGSIYHSNYFTPTTPANSRMLIMNRPVINISGGGITINEFDMELRDVANAWTFMAARDIISGGMVIPDGSAGVVEYRLTITV